MEKALGKAIAVLVLGVAVTAAPTLAQQQPIDLGKQVGLDQKLNAQVPLNVTFQDETGATVPLGKYFGSKPVVLVLPFYTCPGICALELDGMVKAFRGLDLAMGKDYEVVTISINPKETPALAAAKHSEYASLYAKPGADTGWHFLVGTDANIHAVANAVGFRYVYDKANDQYAHPAGIIVLTPDGRTSHYFYGVDYMPRDLRFALITASRGRIGSLVDQIKLLCYHIDPATGKYGLLISRVLQLAGGATVLALGTFMTLMFLHDRKRARATAPHDGSVQMQRPGA
ncbi:MAG: SCO family protein [Chthonomonadales bacterium]